MLQSRAELSRPAALPPGRGSAEMNVPATPAPHAAVLHTKGACRKPGSASDPAAPAGFSRCDPLAGVPPAPPGRAEPTGPAPPPLTAPRLCYRGCVPRPGPAAQPSGRLIAPQGSERAPPGQGQHGRACLESREAEERHQIKTPESVLSQASQGFYTSRERG